MLFTSKTKLVSWFTCGVIALSFIFLFLSDPFHISLGDFLQVLATMGVLWIVIYSDEKTSKASASVQLLWNSEYGLHFLIKNDSTVNDLSGFILKVDLSLKNSRYVGNAQDIWLGAGSLRCVFQDNGQFEFVNVEPIITLDREIVQFFKLELRPGDEPARVSVFLSGGNTLKNVQENWNVFCLGEGNWKCEKITS